MAFDNSRGAFYDADSDVQITVNDSANKTVLESEDVSLSCGVVRVGIPATGADIAPMEAIKGKLRVFTLSGTKHGTQAQIETFIKSFTDRTDLTGVQGTMRYYPLFGPGNTLAGSGQQDKYYTILINNFSYRASLDQVGFMIDWELELFEGSSVLETLGIL